MPSLRRPTRPVAAEVAHLLRELRQMPIMATARMEVTMPVTHRLPPMPAVVARPPSCRPLALPSSLRFRRLGRRATGRSTRPNGE
eukprot:7162398-Prymnesium_polylepis.1